MKEILNMDCIVCKKNFDSEKTIIKEGKLKGCKVVNVYCSDKCREEMDKRIRELD